MDWRVPVKSRGKDFNKNLLPFRRFGLERIPVQERERGCRIILRKKAQGLYAFVAKVAQRKSGIIAKLVINQPI